MREDLLFDPFECGGVIPMRAEGFPAGTVQKEVIVVEKCLNRMDTGFLEDRHRVIGQEMSAF